MFSGIFLKSDSLEPSYILELDSLGNGICGAVINNVNDDQNAITIDPLSSDIYFGGDYDDYSNKCIFGTDTLHNVLNVGENSFLAKWQPCNHSTDGIYTISSNTSSISVFPNPSPGLFTLSLSNVSEKCNIEIYNVLGEKVCAQFNIQHPTFKIDLSSNPDGVYLYRVVSESGNEIGNGKMIIDR